MRQILLSPEFQVYKPFFVILVLIFLVSVAFLIIKIMEVYNKGRNRKLLENFFYETENGGNIMKTLDGKTMFEQALQGVVPTGASGNQTKQIQGLMQIMQSINNQSTGIVQRMRQLALTQAASAEMASGAQIIESVDDHIRAAQGQFDEETPHHVADALGNEALPGQKNLDAPVAEPQADAVPQANTDTPVEIPPETSAGVSQETDEASIRKLIASPELRGYFAQSFAGSGTGVNIDNGYSFSSIPKELFAIIYAHFNGMKDNGGDHKRAYDFLQRVKSERNGA